MASLDSTRLAEGILAELQSLERHTLALSITDDPRTDDTTLGLGALEKFEASFLDTSGAAIVEAALKAALEAQAMMELLEAPRSPVRARSTAKCKESRACVNNRFGYLQAPVEDGEDELGRAPVVMRTRRERPSTAPAMGRSQLKKAETTAGQHWQKEAALVRKVNEAKQVVRSNEAAENHRPASAGGRRAFADSGLGIGARFSDKQSMQTPGPSHYKDLQEQGAIARWNSAASIPTLQPSSKFRSASAFRIGRLRKEHPQKTLMLGTAWVSWATAKGPGRPGGLRDRKSVV